MKLEQGKMYQTYGSWQALCIWVPAIFTNRYGGRNVAYFIHKPNTEDETGAIGHYMDGSAYTAFSFGEKPFFGKHHPADIRGEA